ncbi:hypothetical protein M758_8G136400 [Ceratodon purpureus]|nr:hypothetical protein M758_8G136400 [Ceratodon purpureus]
MAAALLGSQASASITVGGSRSFSLARFHAIGAACPNHLAFVSRKQWIVRCHAEDSEPGGLKEAEEGVKKTISKLDELLNNDSKKKGFGTKPTSGSLDNPPEVTTTTTPSNDLDFGALFALDEPFPEILSGRLAMFGMACALLSEKTTRLTVFEQVFTHGYTGLVFFVGAVQLLTYASLTPITKGESIDSRSLGPFTPRSERWIGRLAMIGFLSLIVTESLLHAPLFQ